LLNQSSFLAVSLFGAASVAPFFRLMNTKHHIQGDPLEASIDFQALMLHTAETPEERRLAWNELLRLRDMRTADRIEEMEREQGLR
jgi:hypothetical protein